MTKSPGVVKTIANGILFQVGWLLCVFYGNLVAMLVALVALAVYGFFYLTGRGELLVVSTIIVAGVVGDVILGIVGILIYPPDSFLPPFWMITLWLLFATTIPWALRWLVTNRFWFVALCAIGGPLSYFAGVSLSNVSFGLQPVAALSILGLLWVGYGFFIAFIYNRWQSDLIFSRQS